jgi:hypothetical protein
VVALPLKPYYNPANLENAAKYVKQKESIEGIGKAQLPSSAAYQ